VGICGCATTGGAGSTPANDNMDAVVWLQSSAEYAAVTTVVYAAATAKLREIAERDENSSRSAAIVMDVDETVLDNSRYQGQLMIDDSTYDSESWDAWVALRAADAVPGVVDFIRMSQSLGFHVAFITNRTCRSRPDSAEHCPQAADTLANLDAIGVETSSTTLLLRGDRPSERCREHLTEPERVDGAWSSDKTSRRECVRTDRDIIMLFGDQLGDFIEVAESPPGKTGREIATDYAEHWGVTWFMLPNPTYGSWRPRDPAGKRSMIRGVD
jgi:acid phosphatase